MSEADDDIEAIRERKRKELRAQAEDPGPGDGADGETGDGTPGEPVRVEGATHLQKLVGRHDVVLVDFYADWCGPCKMLEPTVESLAAETAAAVAKVDIDAHQDIARQYQVQGVPTLYLFAGGEPVERLVGVQDKATLADLVAQHA